MKQRMIIMMVGSFCFFTHAFCGNGKISGRVIDAETNEPLIGANVIITGTSLGAATDIEGRYFILSVPPGAYALKATYIGYQEHTVSNLRVNADLTTEADFKLRPVAVEVAPVVVVAERPLVNKNATNAVRISTSEELEKLPIRGVQNAVALQPGVVFQDGRLYIRGGRSDEVGYYLEGANTRNVLDGTNLTNIIPEALEEFQVHAGGYNAEYGGANAGIVRQTLKSGTTALKGSLLLETDNFTKQNEQGLGTYSYGYSNYVLTLSGPIYENKIKFFVAGENRFDRDFSVQFWEGFRFENLIDQNADPKTRELGFEDTVRVLEIKPGNIPGMMRNRYTGNGTFTFDFNPFIIRLGGTFSRQKSQGTSSHLPLPVENIFNLGRLGITETSDLLVTAKFTHFVSPTVLYEVNVFYGDNRRKTYDPDHGDNYLLYNDSLANAEFGYRYRSYTIGPGSSTARDGYLLNGFPFDRPGERQTSFIKSRQTRIGGSADFTAQVSTVHEIRAGLSLESYRLRNYSTNGLMLIFYRTDPDQARTLGTERDYQVRRNGRVINYGYDVYGNEIDKPFDTGDPSTIDGPKQPLFFAAYLQDKIEYSDLIINAGLRFDVFNTNDFKFIDDPTTLNVVEGPNNPSVDATTYEYKPTGIEKTPSFQAVSPRLGFSFPVTDRTVFHVQFGKFIQPPALDVLYTGRGEQAIAFTGGNYIPTPVGRGIDPERTTQYEIGFTQQISDNASFDITGFYKDIKGQIQVVRQPTTANSIASGYNALTNGDFATTKGVELSVRIRRVNRVQAQVNYTFSDSKGTGSTTNSAVSSIENGTLYPTVISPLDFNQAHRGAVNVDFRFGENDGGPILERLGANVLFTFNSGHPFTLSTGSIGQQGVENGALVENDARFSQPLESVNASTTPWNFNIDLRLDKTVALGPLDANFYIYVQNLLNTKNVVNVYRRSGNAADDGFLTNPDLSAKIIQAQGQGYVEMYKAINLRNGQHYRRETGNDLWGSPRQIRFGVKFEL